MSPDGLAGLKQPDPRSCGAASVVAARMLCDDVYAAATRPRFAEEVLAEHRRLTRMPPWPRALGTPPWAVARALTGITGTRHRTRLVPWRTGRDAEPPTSGAVYVGNARLPRHVVLAVGGGRCYEPSSGRVLPMDGRPLAGWRVTWFEIGPVAPVTPPAPRSPA